MSRFSRGLSLVELMIALALGAILSTAVAQLFVANAYAYALLVGQSRMQESARFSLAFIARQVRQAGYRGCFSASEDGNLAIAAIETVPYEFDLRFAVQGYEAIGLNSWAPPLSELPNQDADLPLRNPRNKVFKTSYQYGAGNGINLDQIASGTDLLTLRHLSQQKARLARPVAFKASAEPLVVMLDEGWAEFDLDHLVLIHDCEKAMMFRVNSSNPWGRHQGGSPKAKPSAGNLVIAHEGDQKNFLPRSFDRDAAVSAIQSHTFFIAPGAGKNKEGNTPLSLWQKTSLEAPVELVEGVEDLQLSYGIDSDADGVPNSYMHANFVNDWTQVVTLKVRVVVNSVENVGSNSISKNACLHMDCDSSDPRADGLLRRSFSQTIQLRNHG